MHSDKSQFILEYGVIGVLILIAIFSLLAVFGPDLQTSLFPEKPTPEATPAVPLYNVVETGDYAQIDDTQLITATNCISSQEITQTVQITRSIQHLFIIEGEVSESTSKQLLKNLEETYDFADQEDEVMSFNIPVSVEPDMQVDAELEWQFIWQEGQVQVTHPDGSQQNYVYRARTGYEWRILSTDSQPATCRP